MNELDPSLKRLFKLSRTELAPEPEQAPFGFAGRVVGGAKLARPITFIEELQQKAWGIVWASFALVVAAALVLLSQRASAAPEPEISSALNFVANNLMQ